MTRDEVLKKQKDYVFPCVVNYYTEPLVADHGQGQYLWDIEGRRYLDFFGGILTVSVGHCNPKVTTKIKQQLDKLQHSSTVYPTEAMVALAEKVAEITPGRLQKSFFTCSGTEANEAAILTARMATGNFDVVGLRHAYSGHSQLAKSATGMAPWRKSGVVSVGISHALNPYCYRCPLGMTYPSCGVACAQDVESAIQTTTSGAIAAFIAEPIQGAGGFITPPPEYFKMVFTIVKKYGGLFIADEVQTGWGRTGKKWFGIEHWEVEPDIITSAKGMANGSPVGLTVATPEVAGGFKGLTISTFGGNPVTSVAARATIEVIEEENLLENASRVGAYFRSLLEGLQQKHALIGDVRGMGLMQGLEFVKDRKTKEPAPQETNQFMERCRANGLLVGKGGLYGNVIRLSPPLNIKEGDVDQAIRLMDQSLGEVRV
ncbi:MAG TPA: aspartate aminotransferase family protein [Terriglobia bacterium]|nr:aspartate aminotransferase family protein [Terriglobia bacterium]